MTKYAGGYNGDRYSVAGYQFLDGSYEIKSCNSLVLKMDHPTPEQSSKGVFDIHIYRKDSYLFSYVHDSKKVKSSHIQHSLSLIDSVSFNVLFQLDEKELDTLLPMIMKSKNHSFSYNYKEKIYYIHCDSDHVSADEYILRNFNDKFYYDECSLYRKNVSLNKLFRDYSHFVLVRLYHSLSDNDCYLSFMGSYAGWTLVYYAAENSMRYIALLKNSENQDVQDIDETIPVQSKEDFYDISFNMLIEHIISPDYITKGLDALVHDYDLEYQQDWKKFVTLFDMATI